MIWECIAHCGWCHSWEINAGLYKCMSQRKKTNENLHSMVSYSGSCPDFPLWCDLGILSWNIDFLLQTALSHGVCDSYRKSHQNSVISIFPLLFIPCFFQICTYRKKNIILLWALCYLIACHHISSPFITEEKH